MHKSPLDTAHFCAAIIVIIAAFNRPSDPIDTLCAFSVLEKYGLCLAIVMVVSGVSEFVQSFRK